MRFKHVLDRDIRKIGQCSKTMVKLLKLESEFVDMLDRGEFDGVYFFEKNIREEMLDWLRFSEEFVGEAIGFVTGNMLENSLTVDAEINELLRVMHHQVVRISSMNIDREDLIAVYASINPFQRYGFYEFRDNFKELISEHDRLLISRHV